MYRLSRWMTKNGRQEDLKWIMSRWLEAAEQRWPEDVTQAIDPFSGEWSPASPNHSNTLFFLIEAAQTTRESHSLSSKTGNGHASLSRSDKLMASPSLG
jgi:hypothetical protein